MSPLLFFHLAQAGLLGAVPASTLDMLRNTCQAILVANLRLRKTQEQVLRELAARDISAMALKGVCLADRLYGQISLRPVGDIDLCAERHSVAATDGALVQLGFRRLRGKSRLWNVNALLNADLSYLAPSGVKLELHWELTHQPSYRFGLAPRAMFQNASAEWVNGKRLLVLSPADELRFLCVHCAADHRAARFGIRMIWLVDIATFVSALPVDWDWTAFAHETARLRLATPVLVALEACQEYLEMGAPGEALDLLCEAAAMPHERQAWQTAHATATSDTDSMLAHFSALPGPIERLALARGILLPSPRWIRSHYAQDDGHGVRSLRLLAGYASHYHRLALRLRRRRAPIAV
jgi:hypothetical protein